MPCPGLYTGEGRVGEHSDGDTDDNFSADKPRDVGGVGARSEADEEAETNGKEAAAKDDEGFQAMNAHNDDTEYDACLLVREVICSVSHTHR
jgi:hypothetical protein